MVEVSVKGDDSPPSLIHMGLVGLVSTFTKCTCIDFFVFTSFMYVQNVGKALSERNILYIAATWIILTASFGIIGPSVCCAQWLK